MAASDLLDEVNVALLSELRADPRLSMSELARRVGRSAPAVTERVHRLERAGVIAGYRIELDPAALGLPVTAFARIRPAPGQLPKIAKLAGELPQVSECRRIAAAPAHLVVGHVPRGNGRIIASKCGASGYGRSLATFCQPHRA